MGHIARFVRSCSVLVFACHSERQHDTDSQIDHGSDAPAQQPLLVDSVVASERDHVRQRPIEGVAQGRQRTDDAAIGICRDSSHERSHCKQYRGSQSQHGQGKNDPREDTALGLCLIVNDCDRRRVNNAVVSCSNCGSLTLGSAGRSTVSTLLGALFAFLSRLAASFCPLGGGLRFIVGVLLCRCTLSSFLLNPLGFSTLSSLTLSSLLFGSLTLNSLGLNTLSLSTLGLSTLGLNTLGLNTLGFSMLGFSTLSRRLCR